MAKKINLTALKTKSRDDINYAIQRYERADKKGLHYLLVWWIAQMTAVEIYTVWERYVEDRLVAALNHAPQHFLKAHNIVGVSRISSGFAAFIVRGGRYLDFRSTNDLIGKADKWLGKTGNPFRQLSKEQRDYLDCLLAIRNCVTHGSAPSLKAYKRHLKEMYGISSAPVPDEFLNAKDYRTESPMRNKSRLHGLAKVVKTAIRKTSAKP